MAVLASQPHTMLSLWNYLQMDKFELTKRTSSAVGHQDQYEPQSQTQDLAQNWRDIQRCLADAGRT